MYRNTFLNLFKKLVPNFDADVLLQEWIDEAKKKGETKSAKDYAGVFNITWSQYSDILSVILIIRADRQLHAIPSNFKKFVTILDKEFPEFANKTPSPFYGVLNDLYQHSKLPYSKNILNTSYTLVRKATEASKISKNLAVKTGNELAKNVNRTFNLIKIITNPYILAGVGAGLIYWKFLRK
jgi:hypothetical protein